VAKPSATRRIVLGLLALATIPAIGWVSFSYHVAVGIAVTLIYGSGALVFGAMSIVSGIAIGAERQLPGDPEPIPAARMLERRNPNA
jgi:hypothetical protein